MNRRSRLPVVDLDVDPKNADWTKQSWDLPPYKSREFMELYPDLEAFRKLPVYQFAVKQGKILNDEWAFARIKFDTLNSRQKENFNFQSVAGALAVYGYNCIKLADDWKGADFLALHVNGNTLKVQLKSRLTINEKYRGKEIWIAFPFRENLEIIEHDTNVKKKVQRTAWYVIPHDVLIAKVGAYTNWLTSESWTKHGGYSSAAPSKELMLGLCDYKI